MTKAREAVPTGALARKGRAVRLDLPDGCTRPYRPCPADFAERYVELGQGKGSASVLAEGTK